jgi:hypothetical protein
LPLQKEIENLRHTLTNVSSSTDENAQKLKETYLLKLNALESQVCKDIIIFVVFLMY